MKPIRQGLVCWAAAAFFSVLSFPVTAAAEPFQTAELKRFLAESTPFLEWVRTNHQEQVVERLMEKPRSIAGFPAAVRYLRERRWEPERFAYILNHVLVAYKRLGAGKAPSQLLKRLEQTGAAVRADATQSEAEKARTLAAVAEAQREVQETDKAFAQLPPEEVRLMWFHRAELRKALEGNLPLRERVLPNPAKKPAS
jgi:hypothetical protein